MLLGLDLGTGSLKALLLDFNGQVRGEASRPYPVAAPHPGWAESDPEDWWRAAAEATQAAVGPLASQVVAVGLSGQMHGVVLSDPAGQPLRPAILWADGRAVRELSALKALPESLRHRLANPLVVGMAAPSLLWLERHEPRPYAEARWALQPKDWLRLRLTGQAASEPSDASGTLLYDLLADTWAWEALERLGLRTELLPPLLPSGAVAGHLTRAAARWLGLPEGLPVATGAADTAAALLGSGLAVGQVQLTVGSGAQIAVLLDTLQIDPTLRTHRYRAARPQQWYALAAMQNAGLALEWVRNMLHLSWEEAYREAQQAPAGCEGLCFLPYLTGERTPHLNPQARGVWAGLRLNHQRGHLMRAALEGVAYSLREGLEALGAAIPPQAPLRLSGGGSQEPFWQQMLSDVLGRPLVSTPTPSASARGAALLAGMAVGITLEVARSETPVAEPQSSIYEEGYQRYKQLYRQLSSWF
ncbi:xylulose kinase [Meiothermus taiwanensis]|jgi:xylulokinase|nr:xylulose kinase [Meiothermus taiwanensis]GAO76189.1 xylulokinase [Meiothermus ruber H328]